jgi:hypothetical protein
MPSRRSTAQLGAKATRIREYQPALIRAKERRFAFESLATAPIIVDAVYERPPGGGAQREPISKMFPKIGSVPGIGNMGGFRAMAGQSFGTCRLLIITSSGEEADWPDVLDAERGVFTYFGDNRQPGKELHDTPKGGNRLLRDMFAAISAIEMRPKVPPSLIFTKANSYGSMRFRGLAVPSSTWDSGLVAIWRQTNGRRFQNYRAEFEILNCDEVPRPWLTAIQLGDLDTASRLAPTPWKRWVERGEVARLCAPRTIEHRTRGQQLPRADDVAGYAVLQELHSAFSVGGRWPAHDFEFVAAELFRLIEPRVQDLEVTRPTADGGRDAVGRLRIGGTASQSDGIYAEFALEAKAYGFKNGVGVSELSRLISRLRHRQFGVLLTTSYLSQQAYVELREDRHPVVVMSGVDIVEILRGHGIRSPAQVTQWLERILA